MRLLVRLPVSRLRQQVRSLTWSLSAIGVLVVATTAVAQPVPQFHPPSNLSNTLSARSDLADLATDGSRVVAVWREQSVETSAHVVRFRAAEDGRRFNSPIDGRSIATFAEPTRVLSLRVAASGSNVLVLVAAGSDARDAQLFLIRSADGGGSFAPPTPVPGPGSAPTGDIALSTNGDAHLVIEDGESGDIVYRRSTNGGRTFLPPFPITHGGDWSAKPRVSVNGDRVALVWQETGNTAGASGTGEIVFAQSTDAGVTWSTPINMSTTPDVPSESPVVSALNAIHVAWLEDGVVVHRRSADGTLFTATTAVSGAGAGEAALTPDLSGEGDLLNVVWTTIDASRAIHGPYFRRSSDGGVLFSSQLDLRDGLTGSALGLAAVGGGMPATVVWPHSSTGNEFDGEVLALPEIACSKTWTNPVSGMWTVAASWSPAGVPGPADNVCITVDGTYTVTARGTVSISSLRVGAAANTGRQTLVIEGFRPTSSAVQHASLTTGIGLDNFGTIQLSSTGVGVADASLIAPSGEIHNMAAGLLETLPGSGGNRTITGTLVNDGNVHVMSNTTKNSSSTNNNVLLIGPAVTLTVPSSVFNQNAGSVSTDGVFNQTGGSFNFNGGTVSGTIGINAGTLNIGAGSTGAGVFAMRGTSSISGNIAASQSIIVEGLRQSVSATTPAVLSTTGSLTNAGSLTLTGSGVGTASATLNATGVLTNAGRLEVMTGSGGLRTLTGVVVNDGIVTIDAATTLNGAHTFTNNNLFTVSPASTFTASGGAVFNQNAGTLSVDGVLNQTAGTFNFHGGTITGNVTITSAALNIGAASVGAGSFVVNGTSTFSGNIASGQTVRVEGLRPSAAAGTPAVLTAAAAVTNAGTLALTSSGISTQNATVTVNGGLTITSTGLLEFAAGSGGARTFNGGIVNHGTIGVDGGATFNGPHAVTNLGMIAVAPSASLTFNITSIVHQNAGTIAADGIVNHTSGTFNFNGGVVLGSAVITGGALNIGAGSIGAGAFVMRGNASLSGNVAAAQSITIEAQRPTSTTSTPAFVTASGSFTNNGRIVLTSTGVTGGASAQLTVNGTLTNAPGSILESRAGQGGLRTISGGLRNDGSLQIGANTTHAAGTLTNVSPGIISGGATLTMAAGTTFSGTGDVAVSIVNNGAFNAGLSPGLLNLTGNYTQSASGVFNVEIGGPQPGTGFDQLNISGAATLAGTLNVIRFEGFCPTGTFAFMTFGSRTGDFTTTNGLNQPPAVFTAIPGATSYELSVTGCNTPPTANDDSFSASEDSALTLAAPGVLGNDTDAQNDTLTTTLVTGPTNGVLTLNADGSFVYTPNANVAGTDTFTYRASDGSLNSNDATVTITIDEVNDPPVATDDAMTVDEDSANNPIDVLANDHSGPDAAETLSILAVTQGTHGSVAILADGRVSYTPNANFAGADSFTYTVDDGRGGTAVASVAVTVTAINDPPVVQNRTVETDEDTALPITLAATDPDSPAPTITFTAPSNGTFNGTTYTPNPNFNGTDRFSYTATDSSNASATATVTITVRSVNDPPAVQNLSAATDEDTPLVITLSATDLDSPPPAITFTTPVNGLFDGTTYDPNENFHGTDTFTYTATDSFGASATATVTVTVRPVNDAPLLVNPGPQSGVEGATVTLPLNATDRDADTLLFTASGLPAGLSINASTGVISGAPAVGSAGVYTVTVTVDDNHGGIDRESFQWTVSGVVLPNRPPVCSAAQSSPSVIANGDHRMVPINVVNVTDPDGDPVTILITGIFQDEPTNMQGDGNTPIDGVGVGTALAQVRAERGVVRPNANGRVYEIFFRAADPDGGSCTGSVLAGVPRNNGTPAVDDGVRYDSTVPTVTQQRR